MTLMVCLGGGRAQTLAPHFHYLWRVPASRALAGGEPGFGATVMPSHSQASSPKGKRKWGHCGLSGPGVFPSEVHTLSVFQRSVQALASNMGPGSELRAVALPLRFPVHLRLGSSEASLGASAASGCIGRAAEAQVHPQHGPLLENRKICGICDPGTETLWHISLLLPCLWAFCH